MSRILIVEDDRAIALGLRLNLRRDGHDVRIAQDGETGLRMALEPDVDLIVLDVMLPGLNGYELLKEVRKQGSTASVLMLTAKGMESDKILGLKLGADDYLSKPFGVAELLARIKALLRRATPRSTRSVPNYCYQGLEVDFSARRARVNGAEVRLTRREFEVLAYFARNAGKTLLHRQVLQAVWGGQYGDEADYVWTFVQRIRRKIEANRSEPRYLLTESGVGYRMPSPDGD
jgi:two-component system, OmpR family, alkaline phosphatase synthesis response regulator PhoP